MRARAPVLHASSSRRALLAAALVTAAAIGRPAHAADLELPIVEKTLDNGLEVLVLEDHDIPNVALYVVWRVGSRNEVPGITGIAHFFEHMMFMGGAKYGKRFDPIMEAAGGSNNAYTSRDVTVYQDWFPAPKLELILDMEADRMRGMVFSPETVESERGVVASEKRLSMEQPAEVISHDVGPDFRNERGMGLRFLEMSPDTQKQLDELYERLV